MSLSSLGSVPDTDASLGFTLVTPSGGDSDEVVVVVACARKLLFVPDVDGGCGCGSGSGSGSGSAGSESLCAQVPEVIDLSNVADDDDVDVIDLTCDGDDDEDTTLPRTVKRHREV